MAQPSRARFFVLFLLLVLFTSGIVWFIYKRYGHRTARTAIQPVVNQSTPTDEPSPEPTQQPSQLPSASLEPSKAASPQQSLETPVSNATPLDEQSSKSATEVDQSYVGQLKLIIPVPNVKPNQLRDTFDEARSEGRVHDAIDIPAPQGTPVLAVADGQIAKLFQSVRGGTTIYQYSSDRKVVYYYAHLQGYADGLTEGKFVKQGEVIGYVGDTGNAGAGNYHLHFSIAILADPKRYWEGTNINPYPILHK
jgi:murein DD-endopeptidase MepM/ murein hydrolase activator NlpD